jgi:FG-GAP-like repeat
LKVRNLSLGMLVVCLCGCGGRAAEQHGSTATGAAGTKGSAGATGTGGASWDAGVDQKPCAFRGFAPPVSYETANEPLAILALDRTGNGHLDLVVSERGYGVYSTELMLNARNGAFSLAAVVDSATDIENLVAADFNGDGKLDLAKQVNGTLGLDFGTQAGLFATEWVWSPTPQASGYLAVGDFNQDGQPDLAFAGHDNGEIYGGLPEPIQTHIGLNLLFNAGDGAFAAPTVFAEPNSVENLATGDFDGDGRTDLVGITGLGGGSFGVFYDQGGELAGEVSTVVNPDREVHGLAIADFNGDGKDDLATTTILQPNSSNQAIVLDVFRGSTGGFDGPVSYPVANAPSVNQLVTGDFNGDREPDLAMVIGSSINSPPIQVVVFPNLGDGTFGAPVTYTVGGHDTQFAMALAAGDFNGDGVTDIAVATTLSVNVLLSMCD